MTENKFDLTIYGEPATEQPPTASATEQTLAVDTTTVDTTEETPTAPATLPKTIS